MAKQPLGIFSKTEPGDQVDNSDLDQGRISPVGVGLRGGELEALRAIGSALGDRLDAEAVAVNSLCRRAIRQFIEDFRAGKITLDMMASDYERPKKPRARLKR